MIDEAQRAQRRLTESANAFRRPAVREPRHAKLAASEGPRLESAARAQGGPRPLEPLARRRIRRRDPSARLVALRHRRLRLFPARFEEHLDTLVRDLDALDG